MDKEKQKLKNKAYYQANKGRWKAYGKAYHKAHRTEQNAKSKDYWVNHPGKAKAYSKAYYELHKEERRAYSKGYRKANKKLVKAYNRVYCKANPDKYRQYNRNHRAQKRTTQIEPINEKIVYLRDGWRCQHCKMRVGKNLEYPHPMSPSLDHIVPLSQGGTHTYANVQLAHLTCNVSKQDKVLPQGEQLRWF